ncbi:MAG: hypothetical protein EOO53_11980 [Gammaproteobacteria bacterium]|nr:MAG: hypothetical protein EOO53_11980 [Gammaproteobacteria bacterium]
MKSKIVLSIVFLLPIQATLAEIWLPTDSNQVCEGRNNVFKSGLEAAIKTKQNVAAAKAELI